MKNGKMGERRKRAGQTGGRYIWAGFSLSPHCLFYPRRIIGKVAETRPPNLK